MRVDAELTKMLEKFHPLWLNIHVNHPNEITSELAEACDNSRRRASRSATSRSFWPGSTIASTSSVSSSRISSVIRVRPYYLYQCDMVDGAGHFRTPVAKGIEIIEGLRGHTSGYAVPTFVIDAPAGGGKIPLMPNYALSQSRLSRGAAQLRGIDHHLPGAGRVQAARCQYVRLLPLQRPEPGQAGVTGLLDGEQLFIKPEGFDAIHSRGGASHRLRTDASKWQPHGIGAPPPSDEPPSVTVRKPIEEKAGD